MQQVNQTLTVVQNTQGNSQTTTKQPTFSDHERDVTGYFWLRLSNVYGVTKLETTWPGELLKRVKMEYAKDIGRYDREQIHKAFDAVKRERERGNQRFEWPNVDAILGILKSPPAAQKVFTPRLPESKHSRAARKMRGHEEMQKILGNLEV